VVSQRSSASATTVNTSSRIFGRWSAPSFSAQQARSPGPNKSGLPPSLAAQCHGLGCASRKAAQYSGLLCSGASPSPGRGVVSSGVAVAWVQVSCGSRLRSQLFVALARASQRSVNRRRKPLKYTGFRSVSALSLGAGLTPQSKGRLARTRKPPHTSNVRHRASPNHHALH
jgi:hypothetical protein